MRGKSGSLTLTQRLFVLSAVAVAPAFLILVYNLVSLRSDRATELNAQALQTGRIAALEMDRIIFGSEDVLRAVATSPTVERLDNDCNSFLARVDTQTQRFSTIRVLGREGVPLCSSEARLPKISLSDRNYFQKALEAGDFVVGTYTIDRADNRPVLPLALPTRGPTGQIERVIVGTLDLEWLGRRVQERDFSDGNALTIADADGVILAREPFPERFVGTRIPDEFQRLVNAAEPGTVEVTSQDGTQRIIGYVPVSRSPYGLYVSAGIARAEMYRPLEEASIRGLMLAVAGLAVALMVAYLTGRALVRRPVDRLLKTVEAWRRGDEAARTGMSASEGELGTVGLAIDDYMDQLVSDRRLRREAEVRRELLLRELDHRVKNVLATVQAIARQTFRPGVDPADAMAAYSARLTAIANAHTLLISNDWQRADLGEAVSAAVSPFRASDDTRFEIAGPPLVIQPKTALSLSMALHELCTNSVKYGALGHDQGRVEIRWSTPVADTGPSFSFEWREHDGPPVEPPERSGFGSRMIERLLAAELDADVELDFPRTGVTCRITAPLENVVVEEERPPDPPNPARAAQPNRPVGRAALAGES